MLISVKDWIIKEGRNLDEVLVVICLTDKLYPNFKKGEVYPICDGHVQMDKDHYIFSLPLKMRKIRPESNNFMIAQGSRSDKFTAKDNFIKMLAQNGVSY